MSDFFLEKTIWSRYAHLNPRKDNNVVRINPLLCHGDAYEINTEDDIIDALIHVEKFIYTTMDPYPAQLHQFVRYKHPMAYPWYDDTGVYISPTMSRDNYKIDSIFEVPSRMLEIAKEIAAKPVQTLHEICYATMMLYDSHVYVCVENKKAKIVSKLYFGKSYYVENMRDVEDAIDNEAMDYIELQQN